MQKHEWAKWCFGFLVAAGASGALAAPELVIKNGRPAAIYQAGETLVWQVSARGVEAGAFKEVRYTIKNGGGRTLTEGDLSLAAGQAPVKFAVNEPCALLLEVTAKTAGAPDLKGLAGALVAPDQIAPSAPRPDDFDSFWTAKLAELAAVPPNPVLTAEESGKPEVAYWKISMDNIRGTKIRGQLARAARDGKYPAMLLVQYAGVYGLPKANVLGPAAEGWLALNISAHDLPIDEPEAFYQQQSTGALKNYVAIGNDDREKSYFLRMFLACYRAVEYLAHRPDWDGQTLLVTGTSQGGLQALVAAGLHSKVTAMMALVPAGCDNTAPLAGRKAGWPYWISNAAGKAEEKARETSRYFDGVNFAARIKCPALIGVGLVDVTSPPAGVYAAFNLLQGPKEMVVMPDSDHKGRNNTQAPYRARSAEWRKALLSGNLATITRPAPAP